MKHTLDGAVQTSPSPPADIKLGYNNLNISPKQIDQELRPSGQPIQNFQKK